MKRIVWKMPDGSIRISIPLEPFLENESEQEYLDRIADKVKPDPLAIRVADLPEENMPADRSFREAWTWTTPDPVIDIDFAKAKEITKNRLRMEREPLLKKLDIEFQKALETGADTTAIIAEKQRLRDITKLADTCTTLEELEGLKKKGVV